MRVCDYAGLLRLSRGYVVSELLVGDQDWLAERKLKELRLTDEGILVLGVEKRPTGPTSGRLVDTHRSRPAIASISMGPPN